MQVFRYVDGAAQGVGVCGAAILGVGGARHAMVLYDASQRTLFTATLWPQFLASVSSSLYLQFSDDANTSLSLLFPSEQALLAFLGKLLPCLMDREANPIPAFPAAPIAAVPKSPVLDAEGAAIALDPRTWKGGGGRCYVLLAGEVAVREVTEAAKKKRVKTREKPPKEEKATTPTPTLNTPTLTTPTLTPTTDNNSAKSKRKEEKRQVAPAYEALRAVSVASEATTEHLKKRAVADLKALAGSVYSSLDGRVADEEVKGVIREVLKEEVGLAAAQIRAEPRDQVDQQLQGLVRAAAEALDGVVAALRAGASDASASAAASAAAEVEALRARLAAKERECGQLMDTLASAAERVDRAEKAAADLEAVCDQWRKRVAEQAAEVDQWKAKAADATQEMEDLSTLQKGKKLTWIPDKAVSRCLTCQAKFGALKWHHHCRNCGRIFCASCASKKTPIPQLGYRKPVRVCDTCVKILRVEGEEGGVEESKVELSDSEYTLMGSTLYKGLKG